MPLNRVLLFIAAVLVIFGAILYFAALSTTWGMGLFVAGVVVSIISLLISPA